MFVRNKTDFPEKLCTFARKGNPSAAASLGFRLFCPLPSLYESPGKCFPTAGGADLAGLCWLASGKMALFLWILAQLVKLVEMGFGG